MPASSACTRTLKRLMALSLIAALAFAGPARAEGDGDDTHSRLGDWVERARAKVQEHADKLPPELARWIPRASRGGAKRCPETHDGNQGGLHPQWPGASNVFGGGDRVSAATLDRVEIGYQAGVLKVCDARGGVLYAHHRPGSELVAIDSVEYAPLDDRQRNEIFGALDIHDPSRAARSLIDDYASLPHTKALAVLGVIASIPNGGLSDDCAAHIRSFLTSRLRAESDVKVHRMAVLSLALASETDERSANAVLDLMDGSGNAWETFTCQQYFAYHRDEIRSWSSFWRIRGRLAVTGNPYGRRIASGF